MSQKIFANNSVTTRKGKVTLNHKKPAYVGMYVLDLTKFLVHKFHFHYIKKMWKQLKTISN